MKVIDIKNAEIALQKLSHAELPINIAYKLSTMIDSINVELDRYDTFRNSLVKKYGECIEADKYKIKDDNKEQFEKEMNDLLLVDIDTITPVFIDPNLLTDLKFSILDLKSLIAIGVLTKDPASYKEDE